MFSYNVLRKHCSNTLETFLKYVAATSCANVFTTFPQRCVNVFATFEYDVKATSGGNIFTTVAQHLSNVPGLRCSNVSVANALFHEVVGYYTFPLYHSVLVQSDI